MEKDIKLQLRHLDFHEKIHPPPTQHPGSFPKAKEDLPLSGVCASSNVPFQMLMPDFRPDPLIGLPDIGLKPPGFGELRRGGGELYTIFVE
ncbi:hypothetical protein CDAR_216541, partial [Caerostris darwini]